MSSHMNSVLKQALITFTSKPDHFKNNLDQLINLFSKTTPSHVNLNPIFMKESTWYAEEKAPMTYVQIYKNNILNIAIFILKPNMKLPLHDHPQMFGLLKVIAGTVRIKSFSIDTPKILRYNRLIKSGGELLEMAAEQLDELVLDVNSKCCILRPDVGNIHEIESIGGPAAFIDILSPPYETEIDTRKCSYFRVFRELEPQIVHLQEIDIPNWFWCDTSPYLGPLLMQ